MPWASRSLLSVATTADGDGVSRALEPSRARESEPDETPVDHARKHNRPPDEDTTSLPRSLGLWLTSLIILALVVLFGTVCFLTWLWFSDRGQPAWRRLVISSYVAQSITISAVLIRAALGILAPITTFMIAAIVLERRGVPLNVLLPVSTARHTNSGPVSLITYALSPSILGGFFSALVSLHFLLAVAAQFSSTLLVYDLNQLSVLDFTRTVSHPYRALNTTNIALEGNAYDYYRRRPEVFATFAEYTSMAKGENGVNDTGPTIRAFLPIANQTDRERLQKYKGTSRVLDMRVACVRPQVTNVRVCGAWPTYHQPIYQLCGGFETNTAARQGLGETRK